MFISLNPVFSLRNTAEKKLKKRLIEKAKKIVSLFSRGNPNLQRGAYVSRADKDAMLQDLLKKFRKI